MGEDEGTTETDVPRTRTPTDDRQKTSVEDRWYPPSDEPWRLKLIVGADYVRTDRETFHDVSIAVFDDDERQIDSVDVGPVTVDNGFERKFKERDGGCCPGGEFEQFYGRTETISVDRFPRHVVATSGDCHSGDRLSVSTFDDGSYYVRRYVCGETPWVFEE